MSHLTSEEIFQLLDGLLETSEQELLSQHISMCVRCRREVELHRAIDGVARRQPLVKPSARFTTTVMQRIVAHDEESILYRVLRRSGGASPW